MVYNLFVKAILKSPLHGILSGSTMLVTYSGARSGREYTVPVNYVAPNAGQTLLTTSRKNRVWWRNFRAGRAVTLRLRGVDLPAHAITLETNSSVIDGLEELFQFAPHFARFFKLSLDQNGKPDPARLEELAAEMVVVRFHLSEQENH